MGRYGWQKRELFTRVRQREGRTGSLSEMLRELSRRQEGREAHDGEDLGEGGVGALRVLDDVGALRVGVEDLVVLGVFELVFDVAVRATFLQHARDERDVVCHEVDGDEAVLKQAVELRDGADVEEDEAHLVLLQSGEEVVFPEAEVFPLAGDVRHVLMLEEFVLVEGAEDAGGVFALAESFRRVGGDVVDAHRDQLRGERALAGGIGADECVYLVYHPLMLLSDEVCWQGDPFRWKRRFPRVLFPSFYHMWGELHRSRRGQNDIAKKRATERSLSCLYTFVSGNIRDVAPRPYL